MEYLHELDFIWYAFKLGLTLFWFILFGAISLFIMHFKPTRKLMQKLLKGDIEFF